MRKKLAKPLKIKREGVFIMNKITCTTLVVPTTPDSNNLYRLYALHGLFLMLPLVTIFPRHSEHPKPIKYALTSLHLHQPLTLVITAFKDLIKSYRLQSLIKIDA